MQIRRLAQPPGAASGLYGVTVRHQPRVHRAVPRRTLPVVAAYPYLDVPRLHALHDLGCLLDGGKQDRRWGPLHGWMWNTQLNLERFDALEGEVADAPDDASVFEALQELLFQGQRLRANLDRLPEDRADHPDLHHLVETNQAAHDALGARLAESEHRYWQLRSRRVGPEWLAERRAREAVMGLSHTLDMMRQELLASPLAPLVLQTQRALETLQRSELALATVLRKTGRPAEAVVLARIEQTMHATAAMHATVKRLLERLADFPTLVPLADAATTARAALKARLGDLAQRHDELVAANTTSQPLWARVGARLRAAVGQFVQRRD